MVVVRLVLTIVALAGLARSQGLGSVEWGFDGTAVSGRFNLLSVVVDNPTDEVLDTELILQRTSLLGTRLGAPIVRDLYLSPRSRRLVQFAPFVTSRRQPWSLEFARSDLLGIPVPRPAAGAPAVVLLENAPLRGTMPFRVRQFHSGRFPTSVTATAGLGAMILDRRPSWDKPRRQAFMDWIHAGGTVHLLQTYTGYPSFRNELEPLNREASSYRLGAGRVVRHEFTRETLRTALPRAFVAAAPGDSTIEVDVAESLYQKVDVRHDWVLIDLLAVLYVIAVGPWFWRWSTKKVSWNIALPALAGIVAVASFAFSFVADRGVSEHAVVHSSSYAVPLGGGRYDVTRYANAFVTHGSQCVIRAHGSGDVFTAAQVHEGVNGTIRNGLDGAFRVEMPKFSWRSLVHRRVVEGPDWSLERAPGDRRSGPLRLITRGGPIPGVQAAWAYRAGVQIPVALDGATHEMHLSSATTAASARALIADRLDADGDTGEVVFVQAGIPVEFGIDADGFGPERGLVLFRFDLTPEGR